MKYKVGDRVLIKSIDWYNKHKDKNGVVLLTTQLFTPGMSQFCGKVMTIEDVFEHIDNNVVYYMEETDYDWTDEMIEGLVEEEIIDIDDFQDDNEIIDIIDEYVHRLKNNECQINLPEGYQFTDENGNVINATKIVLEKKKKEYPKTYEECCRIIGFCSDILKWDNPFRINKNTHPYIKHLDKLMGSFYKLLICRDAYWKIAGDEMGLGKLWKPDWTNEEWPDMYYISFDGKRLEKEKGYPCCNMILIFPTEEMRDAFYENFKSEIEICKELL